MTEDYHISRLKTVNTHFWQHEKMKTTILFQIPTHDDWGTRVSAENVKIKCEACIPKCEDLKSTLDDLNTHVVQCLL